MDARCLQLEFRWAVSACIHRGVRDRQDVAMRIQQNPKQALCWEKDSVFLQHRMDTEKQQGVTGATGGRDGKKSFTFSSPSFLRHREQG